MAYVLHVRVYMHSTCLTLETEAPGGISLVFYTHVRTKFGALDSPIRSRHISITRQAGRYNVNTLRELLFRPGDQGTTLNGCLMDLLVLTKSGSAGPSLRRRER